MMIEFLCGLVRGGNVWCLVLMRFVVKLGLVRIVFVILFLSNVWMVVVIWLKLRCIMCFCIMIGLLE